jgi:hypothetical protein
MTVGGGMTSVADGFDLTGHKARMLNLPVDGIPKESVEPRCLSLNLPQIHQLSLD